MNGFLHRVQAMRRRRGADSEHTLTHFGEYYQLLVVETEL